MTGPATARTTGGEVGAPAPRTFVDKVLAFIGSDDLGRVAWITALVATTFLAIGLEAFIPVSSHPEGGPVERLYRADAFTVWQHMVDPRDYHHPGLWFALVRLPFRWFHHSLVVPAVLDRGLAILAVPLAAWLLLVLSGRLASVFGALFMALLPLLQEEAHDVTDETLFVALAILTLLAYFRVARGGGSRWRWTLGLALGASFHASYATVVLAAALTVDALLPGRDKRVRLPLGAGLLIGSPRWLHLLGLIPLEIAQRKFVGALPYRHWANSPFQEFLKTTIETYFTSAVWLLLPFLVLGIWLGGSQLARLRPLAIGIAAYGAVLFTQPIFRVRDYYAMLFPILFLLYLAALVAPRQGDEALARAVPRRIFAFLLCGVLALAFANETEWQWDFWVGKEGGPPQAGDVIQAAIRDGATTLAFDSDWQDTTWNFLIDKYGTMGPCFQTSCIVGDQAIYKDTASNRVVLDIAEGYLTDEWSRKSVANLDAYLTHRGRIHVFINRDSIDLPFFAYVESHCTQLAKAGSYETWRCNPPSPASATGGAPSPAGKKGQG